MNSSSTMVWPFGHLQEQKASEAARRIAEFDMSAYSEDPRAIRELQRYMLVRKLLNRPVTMQSKVVDEVWHAFILDTKNYIAFCDLVFGEYLHHRSAHFELSTELPGVYEELFGEPLDAIWQEVDQSANCNNCA